MTESDVLNLLRSENFKQIEDIIDARKRLGQYNVYKHTNPLNLRSVYSNFQNPQEINRTVVKFDEASLVSTDKEAQGVEVENVRHTDSEITIVRMKRTGAVFKRKLNKWNMNDIAIPGDGTHLGESPSMVNLVTLVAQNFQCEGDDEYLVPLSSWDPFTRNEDFQLDLIKSFSDSKLYEKISVRASYTDPNIPCRQENLDNIVQTDDDADSQTSQWNWAGKVSNYLRRHCRKSTPLGDPETTEEDDEEK